MPLNEALSSKRLFETVVSMARQIHGSNLSLFGLGILRRPRSEYIHLSIVDSLKTNVIIK